MPMITIDNRPPAVQFHDGNGLSDGVAAFQAAVLNAGPAAAATRRQLEQDRVAQAFQQAQGARADRGLDLQEQWHQQAQDDTLARGGVYEGADVGLQNLSRRSNVDRATAADHARMVFDLQKQQAESQIQDRQADNARAALGQWGDGANEFAKRAIDVAKLAFGHHGSSGAGRAGYSPVTPNDFSGRTFAFDRSNGTMREVTPGAGGGATGAPTGAPTAPATKQTPATPTVAPEAKLDPEADTRVLQTLQMPKLDPAQRKVLVDVLARARKKDPEAIGWLNEWHAAQKDTVQRAAEDKLYQDAGNAAGDAMDRAAQSGH